MRALVAGADWSADIGSVGRILSIDEAAQWERRYVAGAAARVMLLGVWCLVA